MQRFLAWLLTLFCSVTHFVTGTLCVTVSPLHSKSPLKKLSNSEKVPWKSFKALFSDIDSRLKHHIGACSVLLASDVAFSHLCYP